MTPKEKEIIEKKLEIWVNKWITKRVTGRAVAELKQILKLLEDEK